MLTSCQPGSERQSKKRGRTARRTRAKIAAETAAPGGECALDWLLPEAGVWLSVIEVAEALRVSRRHVLHLIEDGSFDCAIDLAAAGSRERFWRVWRMSIGRFTERARGEAAGGFALEAEWIQALEGRPRVMLAPEIAAHFRCSTKHIYRIASELSDVGAADAERLSLRVSKAELLEFIRRRMS